MGSGLPGSLPSYILCYLLLYISSLANKIIVVVVTPVAYQKGKLSREKALVNKRGREQLLVSS